MILFFAALLKDRTSDVLNVKDFGAKGDGVATATIWSVPYEISTISVTLATEADYLVIHLRQNSIPNYLARLVASSYSIGQNKFSWREE